MYVEWSNMVRRWAFLAALLFRGSSSCCSAFLLDRRRRQQQLLPWRHLPPTDDFRARRLPTRQALSTSKSQEDSNPATTMASAPNTATTRNTTETKLRHGLAKMQIAMTPEFFTTGDTSRVLGPFYSKLNKGLTEVRSSSVGNGEAGLGLFAKKNIKAYTVVSFYPAHALGVDDLGAGSQPAPFFVTTASPDNGAYFAEHSSLQSPYLHCTDQPIFQRPSLLVDAPDENTSNSNSQHHQPPSVYLDVNPQLPRVDNCWVSQMINDGATVQAATTEAAILEYYRRSGAARNCIHIPFGPSPILATLTTKKVKKGQELLTTYGATYWLGENASSSGQDDEPQVTVTPAIQKAIQETANDLRSCLQNSRTVYAKQSEALQAAFDAIEL